MKFGVIALLALGMAGIAGCEVYDEPGVGVVVGPALYDNYYWGGYYDGPFWVYRDRFGHFFREDRGLHESHERAYYGHVGGHEFHADYHGGGGHAEFHGGGGHEGGHGGGGHER